MTEYNWNQLSRLLDENEGVIFIAHMDRFRSNINALKAAFNGRYKNIRIGYSYKTNDLPKLCVEANEQGLYAEVVSGSEFEIAEILGVPGEQVLFNGPTKTNAELNRAFALGSLVNVDSLSEARQIASIASEFSGVIRLGLRCNLDFNWKDRESRFGLSENSGELNKAWELLSAYKNISLEGLHCHTSFDRSATSYNRRIVRLIEIADRFFGPQGPQFIDIGGGLCGPMSDELRSQFVTPPPTFDEYAVAICGPLHQRYGNQGPELILEPGVGLLGNVFDYAFRVEHLKKIGSKWFAVTSGAQHHIKIVPNGFNLPTSVIMCPSVTDGEREGGSIDIAGYTCLEHDIIHRDFEKPLACGDILVAENVGAYSVVSSPDFIRTNPPIFEQGEKGWIKLRDKQSVHSYLKSFSW
ncbi:hypothetical protein F1529_09925 [Alcanivorax sp. VBW004]|uniref:hypothetical protein n=1 Tax=Alcanivorax sp. VBW004 TaxID=1287708 RepID=UPI0012BBCDF5|nr:hypothetical protein [Alcanivorax sp. VBW004]MTT52800.1 hypothetical protein [Alcanivorax sp. VBW004]